jgi:cytochrome c-type biogenesis protein CcmH
MHQPIKKNNHSSRRKHFMITFWILAAILVAITLAFLLPALLGKGEAKADAITRDAANIAILRAQLKELDSDLESGLLQQEQYELARNELQKRVLEEVNSAEPQLPQVVRTSLKPAIALAIAVPALAVGLYLYLGNPAALNPLALQRNMPEVTREQVEDMVKRLAQRMETNPEPKGLALLARSYTSMGRFADAAAMYGKLSALMPKDPDVLIEWADTLAMAQGRSLDGEPEKLIKRAIAINPNHPKALALAGSIDYVHKNYAGALKYWRHMMTLVQPESDLAQAVGPGIERAQAALSGTSPKAASAKQTAPAAGSKALLTGKVDIDPALRKQVADTDTVFIFVRAAQGPRMPLVALRKQVRDLPVTFSFDDAASLSPDRKLSSEANVVVGARISKTGDAMPQPSDIQVLSTTVTPNAKDVKLRLVR